MTESFESLFAAVSSNKKAHIPSSDLYLILDQSAKQCVKEVFKEKSSLPHRFSFGPFGTLSFPYFKMGAIDTLDLFGLDELILFSFYWINRKRYKRALDIGANIGLHSTILAKCGFTVQSFEPDPIHFSKLSEVIFSNSLTDVKPHQAAVSNKNGEAEFVRVLGNTTSSHLAGSKKPYGNTEKFNVPIKDIRELMQEADLIKFDVEGHESAIITSTSADHWQQVDAVLEIGSSENARLIYEHLKKEGLNAFSQKTGWQKVDSLSDMPTSYKDGSLFISTKHDMPWGN